MPVSGARAFNLHQIYGGFLKWGYLQSSPIYRWFFHINHPFEGTPIYGTPHIVQTKYNFQHDATCMLSASRTVGLRKRSVDVNPNEQVLNFAGKMEDRTY